MRVRTAGPNRWVWGVMMGALFAVPAAGQDAPRPADLDGLDPYVGTWLSDRRTTPDGIGFRFGYDLQWYDPARTMVEMLITQHFEDGREDVVLWKGYKGWDPKEEMAYYHAFSPQGRAATGRVYVEDGGLVTEYRGWGPRGPGPEIRDVFHPVEGDTFLAVTYMMRDGAWTEVSRDEWTRVEGL